MTDLTHPLPMVAFGNPFSWGFDQLTGWATGAASDIATGVFSSMVGWVVGGVSTAMGLAMQFALSNDSLAQDCSIDGVADCSRQAFIYDTFSRSRGVSAVLLVLFLVWGIGRAAVTGDFGDVMRKFFVEMPKAVLLSALILQIVIVMLLMTDAISAQLLDPAFAADREEYFAGFERLDDLGAGEGAAASFVMLVLGFIVLVGSVFLWLLMMFRSVAISILVTLAPLVAVLGVTSYAASMQKLMRLLIALIASKIVIVLTLSLGVSVIMNTAVLRDGIEETTVIAEAPAAPGEEVPDAIEFQELNSGSATGAAYQMGTGALVVLLSLFSPMVVMQMIPDSVEQYYMFSDMNRRQSSQINRAKARVSAGVGRVTGRGRVARA